MNQRDVTYTLLLLKRQQFTRVTLHLEINRDSTYWPALRAKPASIGYSKVYEPPAILKDALHKFLQGRKALPQDAQIDMFLGHRQGNFKLDPNPRQRRKTQQYLQQISAEAIRMNYPRYKTRELIHSPISWKYEAVRLQAKLKSGLAIEVRFNAREDHMDEDWYALRILYNLNTKNGFGSLVGLVEDEDGRISGFLCRNPSLGPLLDVLSRAKQHGTLVDWARRERWCRQIIQGISDLPTFTATASGTGRWAGSSEMAFKLTSTITSSFSTASGTPSPTQTTCKTCRSRLNTKTCGTIPVIRLRPYPCNRRRTSTSWG